MCHLHTFVRARWHQHFDNVINFLVVGEKEWKVCSPHHDPDDPQHVITIIQKAGDVVFLPHGWWHQVVTTGGSDFKRRVWRGVVNVRSPQALCLCTMLTFVSCVQEYGMVEEPIAISLPMFYTPNLQENLKHGSASLLRSIAYLLSGMLDEAQSHSIYNLTRTEARESARKLLNLVMQVEEEVEEDEL